VTIELFDFEHDTERFMNWIITHDPDHQTQYTGRYEGKFHNCHKFPALAELQALAAKLPYEFRLLDDDGEVYFTGKCGDIMEADADHAFAPLDWAEQFGCTSMEYRQQNHTDWEQL